MPKKTQFVTLYLLFGWKNRQNYLLISLNHDKDILIYYDMTTNSVIICYYNTCQHAIGQFITEFNELLTIYSHRHYCLNNCSPYI